MARRDACAGTPARDDEALRGKYLESFANRLAADIEGRRELGLARKKIARGHLPGNDPASDLMGNPSMESRYRIEAFVDQGDREQAGKLRTSCINLAERRDGGPSRQPSFL
jgi:hypothetical protein